MLPVSTSRFHQDQILSVQVSDQWIDEFCEHVGSVSAVLKALAKIEGTDRPPALILEAIDDCALLQDLLNQIPVFGGYIPTNPARAPITAGRVETTATQTSETREEVLCEDDSADFGDCYPEMIDPFQNDLPTVDRDRLEARCEKNIHCMVDLLQKFRFRAEGDLRELELLSIGHDWTRLARLAGVLKDSASLVSAYRVVVDASALQGAARIGCRNDVDLALEALRADLEDCGAQVSQWREQNMAS